MRSHSRYENQLIEMKSVVTSNSLTVIERSEGYCALLTLQNLLVRVQS